MLLYKYIFTGSTQTPKPHPFPKNHSGRIESLTPQLMITNTEFGEIKWIWAFEGDLSVRLKDRVRGEDKWQMSTSSC